MSSSAGELNKLIMDILEIAEKLNDFTSERILTSLPKYNKLSDVIYNYNNFIDKLEQYNIALATLSEYKANKFKQLDLYNKLVKVVKKQGEESYSKLTQSGGGLIKTLKFDLEFGDTSITEKIDKLKELQTTIKNTTEDYFTADIKKYKAELLVALGEYKTSLDELKSKKSKAEDDFNTLLNKFNVKIEELSKQISKRCNGEKMCDKINLTKEVREKLERLKKSSATKMTNSSTDSDELSSLKKKIVDLSNKNVKSETTIKQLQKAVRDYKQSIKSRNGSGVVPTLSSAVRFSKVGDLLGLPNSSLVESLKQKKTPMRQSWDSKMEMAAVYRGQQQLSSQGIDKLRELFSIGFINYLKTNNKYDALLLLNKFNSEKSSGFSRRISGTEDLKNFCEFLRTLKTKNALEARAIINSKLKLKEHTNDLHMGLISLIESFISYDTSSFDIINNPDIGILHKILVDIIDVDYIHEINKGKMFKLPKSETSASSSTELDSQKELRFIEGLKAVVNNINPIYFNTGDINAKANKMSNFISQLYNLLMRKDLPSYLQGKFRPFTISKISIGSNGDIDNRNKYNNTGFKVMLEHVVTLNNDTEIIHYFLTTLKNPTMQLDDIKVTSLLSSMPELNLSSSFNEFKVSIDENIRAIAERNSGGKDKRDKYRSGPVSTS